MLPGYEEFTEKIRALGFSTFTPKIDVDFIMNQLFLRGDSRLSDLLVYLAEEGDLRHDIEYGDEVYEKTVRFLKEHDLPSIEEWFREYTWEDPLPWDIVEGPASKKYLYGRYLKLKQENPSSEPICSMNCSGCGACSPQQKQMIRNLPAMREKDRKINLHHPVRKTDFQPVQHVLLEYEYDLFHSEVIP